jgi:hypothetical protein
VKWEEWDLPIGHLTFIAYFQAFSTAAKAILQPTPTELVFAESRLAF